MGGNKGWRETRCRQGEKIIWQRSEEKEREEKMEGREKEGCKKEGGREKMLKERDKGMVAEESR